MPLFDTTPPKPSPPPLGSSEPAFDTVHSALQPFIDIAVADLSGRLGVDDSEIAVLSAVLVVWPNAGLGCPEPGMQYRQVPEDGSLIELGVGGSLYRYHSGGQREPFHCEQPLTQLPSTGDTGSIDS